MPLSTDINLPKSHPPLFPDRCVSCGAAAPGDRVRIGTNAIGWWTLAFWVPGRRFTVEAPACPPCAHRMGRQRRLRLTVFWAAGLAGGAVAASLLWGHHGPMRRWLALGIILACALPYFLWEVLCPRPIDLTAYAETVDYEFRDAGYAEEFAALNGAPMQKGEA